VEEVGFGQLYAVSCVQFGSVGLVAFSRFRSWGQFVACGSGQSKQVGVAFTRGKIVGKVF